jgi:predicted PurR-regulated permease PerM
MTIRNFNVYFFLVILAFASFGAFLLFEPFLSAIFVAALFAIMFVRPYDYLVKILKGRRGVAAGLACLLVTFTLILPIGIVTGLVTNEVTKIVSNIVEDKTLNQENIKIMIDSVGEVRIMSMSLNDVKSLISDESLANFAKNAANKSLVFIQRTSRSAVDAVIWTFVMFFTLFYFFIDGKKFMKKIMQLSPLRDEYEELLIEKFTSMTRATLKGTLVIGIVQGVMGGVAFMIAGIPSPMIWMVIMILISIIPVAGASLIVVPAGVIMLLMGNVWEGIFLIAMGGLISVTDNFMRPKLVGNDTQMHGLLVFFATIGGLLVFGIMGFVIGPIIMALAVALWEIYATEFKDQLVVHNAPKICEKVDEV